VSTRPLGGLGPATTVRDARVPPSHSSPAPVADVRYADGAAFEALGIHLASGRVFGSDAATAPPTVVISRDLADAFWPRGDAPGRQIAIDLYGGLTAEVIGVVASIHIMDARTPARPTVFLPAARFPDGVRDIVIRARGDGSIVPALRTVTAELDPALPLYAVRSMPNLVSETMASDRFTTMMLIVFASAAVLLAAVGVFGVFAADIEGRRKEIGVRLALGSSDRRLIALLLGQALRRASVGVLVGALIALAASRAMRMLLFGVSPEDPASLAFMIALMFAIVIFATMVPAIRALRRSPLSALREA
jgi:ABC-type antimicrobial peptide transport system permease subunit